MDRDIVVIWSDYDITYVTLNGFEIKYGIERGYEIGGSLIDLFDKLNYNNKPLVIDIYDEDYDLSDEEIDAFWERINAQFKNKETKFFTDDELQVLNDTEDVNKFIDKIKGNLQLRASELAKEIQEMQQGGIYYVKIYI